MNDPESKIAKADSGRTIWAIARPWVMGFFACSVIGMILSSQWFVHPSNPVEPGAWKMIVLHYMMICYVWGLLTVGIYKLSARVGWHRSSWLRSILIYLFAGIGFAAGHMLLSRIGLAIYDWLGGSADPAVAHSSTQFARVMQSNLIIFAVIASGCLAKIYYQKLQANELRESKLEAQLQSARLHALRAQLQPHFLFNTLNAIATLIRDQPKVAEEMIVKLSDLLRATLDHDESHLHSLQAELELTRRYLDIEQIRFGDRLRVIEQIDSQALDSLVPIFVLQPIVENAMTHCLSQSSTTVTIVITAQSMKTGLMLVVEDDGPGRTGQPNDVAHTRKSNGLGLSNTEKRLNHLFGNRSLFEAGDGDQKGFVVRMEIPSEPG